MTFRMIVLLLNTNTPAIVSRDTDLMETPCIFQWSLKWEFMYFAAKLVHLIVLASGQFAIKSSYTSGWIIQMLAVLCKALSNISQTYLVDNISTMCCIIQFYTTVPLYISQWVRVSSPTSWAWTFSVWFPWRRCRWVLYLVPWGSGSASPFSSLWIKTSRQLWLTPLQTSE